MINRTYIVTIIVFSIFANSLTRHLHKENVAFILKINSLSKEIIFRLTDVCHGTFKATQ